MFLHRFFLYKFHVHGTGINSRKQSVDKEAGWWQWAIFGWLMSVLWRCWLGGRKGIRPVKTEWWGAGMVIWLERGADLHMSQLMPLPLTVSCFSKIQIGFTFLVPAHLGSPRHRAVKRVYVCMYCNNSKYIHCTPVHHCCTSAWGTAQGIND